MFVVGTEVVLLEVLDRNKGVWLVEVALPRPDLVGGHEFEVLEVHSYDLAFYLRPFPGQGPIAFVYVTVDADVTIHRVIFPAAAEPERYILTAVRGDIHKPLIEKIVNPEAEVIALRKGDSLLLGIVSPGAPLSYGAAAEIVMGRDLRFDSFMGGAMADVSPGVPSGDRGGPK